MRILQTTIVVCARIDDPTHYFPLVIKQACSGVGCNAVLTVRPETPPEYTKLCSDCSDSLAIKRTEIRAKAKAREATRTPKPKGTLVKNPTPPPVYVRIEPQEPSVSPTQLNADALAKLSKVVLGI